jgi:hypothetical protein
VEVAVAAAVAAPAPTTPAPTTPAAAEEEVGEVVEVVVSLSVLLSSTSFWAGAVKMLFMFPAASIRIAIQIEMGIQVEGKIEKSAPFLEHQTRWWTEDIDVEIDFDVQYILEHNRNHSDSPHSLASSSLINQCPSTTYL